MTVPRYTDISHFRAPYQEATFLSGFGAVNPAEARANVVETDSTGMDKYRSDVASSFKKKAAGLHLGVFAKPGSQVVTVIPGGSAPAANMTVEVWMKAQLKLGHIVFANLSVITDDAGTMFSLPKDSSADDLRAASKLAPILAEPGPLSRYNIHLGATSLVIGAVALGAAIWIARGYVK